MNFDQGLFAQKLDRLLKLQEYSIEEFSNTTKIPIDRIRNLLNAKSDPTGGEVLIFSDVLKTDYKYFISNEVIALVEKTEKFFRSTEGIINKQDKRIISETLNIARFYKFLLDSKGTTFIDFKPISNSRNHVQQGIDAAIQLRKRLGYSLDKIDVNPFLITRQMGIQVYRLKLSNSTISGIHLNGKETGKVILINYNDDIYRQNFSVLHEMAHSIFDVKDSFKISLDNDIKDEGKKYLEYRANKFASTFLIPPDLAEKISKSYTTDDEFREISNQFSVNPITLAISLSSNDLISNQESERLKKLKIRKPKKNDPEFAGLSKNQIKRFSNLQEKGISLSFFRLITDAYNDGVISFSKICEVFSLTSTDVLELFAIMEMNADVR